MWLGTGRLYLTVTVMTLDPDHPVNHTYYLKDVSSAVLGLELHAVGEGTAHALW